ncbi:MAG: thioredoxin family protein [Candidatus Aenigmatarchaeota archaeon]
MAEIHILKTKACPSCPKAVLMVRKVVDGMKGITIRETYVDSPEGQKLAHKYHMTAAPTILVGEKVVSVGVPSETSLRTAIEKALRS